MLASPDTCCSAGLAWTGVYGAGYSCGLLVGAGVVAKTGSYWSIEAGDVVEGADSLFWTEGGCVVYY